jgi:hypothetical protein
VDGKPIYYLINQHKVKVPEDAGYVAVINSTEVAINNLELNNSNILFAYTNNSRIEEVTFSKHSVSTYDHPEYGISFPNVGIRLLSSSNNTIFHNNFLNGISAALYWNFYLTSSCPNSWDDGLEGNYWSGYKCRDLYSGHYQNTTGSDGIGDTPYVIDSKNKDNYPLIGKFSDFSVTPENHVQTVCNSSISDFQFNGTAIIFNVSGENGTAGFCRIHIPTALMNGTYRVFVNGAEVSYHLLSCSNSSNSCLYFNYTHSTQEIIIITEFPSLLILPLFMIATLSVAVIYRKRIAKVAHLYVYSVALLLETTCRKLSILFEWFNNLFTV